MVIYNISKKEDYNMPIQKEYVYKNAKPYKSSTFSTLYKKKDRLFKLFDNVLGIDLESLKYKQSLYNQVSPTIILPKDFIMDKEKICGYEQKYIWSYTLENAIYKDIPFERKKDIINSLSNSLKEINKFLIVGDINLENILIPRNKLDNNGYLIDFDFAKKFDSPRIIPTFLTIKDSNNQTMNDNLDTDKIRLFICIISFLYGFNFEYNVNHFGAIPTLYYILGELESLDNNGLIMEYAEYLCKCIDHKEPIEEYFYIPTNHNIENELKFGTDLIRKRKTN